MPILAAVLALACGGDNNDNDNDTIDGDAAMVTATPAGADATSSISSPAPTEDASDEDDDQSLGNGEPVPFQAADQTIEAVLLSEPGPDQRILIFATPNTGQYREAYAELVEPGVAVLAFNASPDVEAASQEIETAVSLAGSRDYPLIFVAAEEETARAVVTAGNVELAGVVAIGDGTGAIAGVPTLHIASDAEDLGPHIRDLMNE